MLSTKTNFNNCKCGRLGCGVGGRERGVPGRRGWAGGQGVGEEWWGYDVWGLVLGSYHGALPGESGESKTRLSI